MSLSIAGRPVGAGSPPFVIAELSANHRGDLGTAIELVDAAAAAGAHAVKLQTYTADDMTLEHPSEHFSVSADHALWGGRSLHGLYAEAHTPWPWHEELFARARKHGMVAFSSPFSDAAVDLLESLQAPAYKIASLEIGDTALLRRVAGTGRPVIVSSGAATLVEVAQAVQTLRSAGCDDIVVLACTSSYPADPRESNLRQIPVLRDYLGVEVGLSDHTRGIGAAVAAVALGASVVEKHLTLRRADGGVDAEFSLEPDELAALVTESATAWAALGEPTPGLTVGEEESRRLRRSLWVVADVRAGDTVGPDNVRSLRPAGGLEPVNLDVVLGRRFAVDVSRGTPLSWDLV